MFHNAYFYQMIISTKTLGQQSIKGNPSIEHRKTQTLSAVHIHHSFFFLDIRPNHNLLRHKLSQRGRRNKPLRLAFRRLRCSDILHPRLHIYSSTLIQNTKQVFLLGCTLSNSISFRSWNSEFRCRATQSERCRNVHREFTSQ